MDVYNSKFALLFAPKGVTRWAITFGQTAYFSVPESEVSTEWHRHEDCHKMQWKRDGYFKFALKYLKYQATVGYYNNPYEIEARKAENRIT